MLRLLRLLHPRRCPRALCVPYAALLISVANMTAVSLIVTMYAFWLAATNHGVVDQARMDQFGHMAGEHFSPALSLVFAALFARPAPRRPRPRPVAARTRSAGRRGAGPQQQGDRPRAADRRGDRDPPPARVRQAPGAGPDCRRPPGDGTGPAAKALASDFPLPTPGLNSLPARELARTPRPLPALFLQIRCHVLRSAGAFSFQRQAPISESAAHSKPTML